MSCEWGSIQRHNSECGNDAKFETLYVMNDTEKKGNMCYDHIIKLLKDKTDGIIDKIWITDIDMIPSYRYNKFTQDFLFANKSIDLNRFVLNAEHGQYKCMFCSEIKKHYVSFKNDVIRHLKLNHQEDIHARLVYTVNGVAV